MDGGQLWASQGNWKRRRFLFLQQLKLFRWEEGCIPSSRWAEKLPVCDASGPPTSHSVKTNGVTVVKVPTKMGSHGHMQVTYKQIRILINTSINQIASYLPLLVFLRLIQHYLNRPSEEGYHYVTSAALFGQLTQAGKIRSQCQTITFLDLVL